MGYTIAEKILMRASGSEHVEPGEIVNARVDVAMSHDNAALVSKVFKEIGKPNVWDANRIVIPIDHRVPANNIKTAEGHKKIREFAKSQNIKHFYDVKEGVCHQIMPSISRSQCFVAGFLVPFSSSKEGGSGSFSSSQRSA